MKVSSLETGNISDNLVFNSDVPEFQIKNADK